MEKEDKFEKAMDLFEHYLQNMTPEEKAQMNEHFDDKRPKGWLSIEEHLPMMFAKDLEQGYSVFKVRDINGYEFETQVTDHSIWYYMVAKPAQITHWLND